MQFQHAREFLNSGDVAVVNCSHQCNVLLMDDANFARFKSGQRHSYHGGFYKKLPAQIAAPHSGNWNVVLHLGGAGAQYRYGIRFMKS